MKKLFLVLTILFSIVTFIGAGYVLYTHGEVSGGYAVVPMLPAITCMMAYFTKK